MAMELDDTSSNGDNGNPSATWMRDEFSINISSQLAAGILLDRALKPKKTEFPYSHLPPRSPPSVPFCASTEMLKKKYRRTMYNKIQLIEKTFGPGVLTYQTPQNRISDFEAKCKRVEEIYQDPNGMSQIIVQAELETLYKNFEDWLDMYYEGLLNHELEARYDTRMQCLGREKKPQTYNFYFQKGELFTWYNEPPSGRLCHEKVSDCPIPLKAIWQRLLKEALRKRSDYTDDLCFFDILLKAVEHKEQFYACDMENSIADLEQGFMRWRILRDICLNIKKVATMILKRFGYEYFFDERREFSKFLPFWAMRYCLVADNASKEKMTQRDWAKDVGKVLYALLGFLKASHDALLEREVKAKLASALELITKDGLTITPTSPDRKFWVFRGKLRTIRQGDLNSTEKVTELMQKNKTSSECGEEEGEFKLTPEEFSLPPDRIFREIEEDEDERLRREEEDSGSDSESEDEMFPPIQDVIIDAVWHTRPEKGRSHLDDRRSKVLSPYLVVPPRSAAEISRPASRRKPYPQSTSNNSQQRAGTPTKSKTAPAQDVTAQNPRRQQRSMAPSPGPSKQARATMIHGSFPLSSPARPTTPASNTRVQAVNEQDNDSSKIILIPTLLFPTIDQHNRRPANVPNQSGEKPDQTKGYQMHDQRGSQQQHGQHAFAQQNGGAEPPVDTAQSPAAQATPDSSDPQKFTGSPVKLERSNSRDRLNPWLNDPKISVTLSMPTKHRPGEPLDPPEPNIDHLLGDRKVSKAKPRSAQAPQQHKTPEEAYRASPAGKFAKQKADDALSTELRENPRWPSSVLEAGVPLTDDWSSKQMPPPTGYSSWEQWRKAQREGGTAGHKLTDKDFDTEISRAFD